jgi:hypothetical protein
MATLSKPTEEMQFIIATDVGSTTTKARLFHKKDGEWRFFVAGEAPTTVEAPYEDVTMGVQNAVREIEELTGHMLLAPGGGMIIPYDGEKGVDLYCTTSSAGGGLQMMVSGLIKSMTAASANRAALGAGAIVMDVIARDDGRQTYQKIRRIRSLRPDMILMAGGTDGGASQHVMEIAELIKAAEPKPRLGVSYQLPIVYAGNKVLRPQIEELLNEGFALDMVDNIRPVLERENTEPARRAVHELFMEHVMSHAPGYNRLMKWTDIDIMPTPAGEGMAIQLTANAFKQNVMGVGLEVASRLMNKMIRPTTIPQTLEDLIVEHSVAREALRLGLKHHRSIATRLKGIQVQRTISDMFEQALSESYIDMMIIDICAGTGGLLSHAPRRVQSMLILTDAWLTEGITRMMQDSVFMMPHLGVVSTVYRDAAWNVFDKDCLLRLGTSIAAKGQAKFGELVMDIDITMPDGETINEQMMLGDLKLIKLSPDEEADVVVTPAKQYDIGAGPGESLEATVQGGVAGLLLDARGRPMYFPEEDSKRKELLLSWFKATEMYDEEALGRLI